MGRRDLRFREVSWEIPHFRSLVVPLAEKVWQMWGKVVVEWRVHGSFSSLYGPVALLLMRQQSDWHDRFWMSNIEHWAPTEHHRLQVLFIPRVWLRKPQVQSQVSYSFYSGLWFLKCRPPLFTPDAVSKLWGTLCKLTLQFPPVTNFGWWLGFMWWQLYVSIPTISCLQK